MWRRVIPLERCSYPRPSSSSVDRRQVSRRRYAKVIFDIGKNAKETVTSELEYQLYDENGQVIDKSSIHTEAGQIQATLPVYVTKELKLTVDFQEAPVRC